jgi:hypothetical protein
LAAYLDGFGPLSTTPRYPKRKLLAPVAFKKGLASMIVEKERYYLSGIPLFDYQIWSFGSGKTHDY